MLNTADARYARALVALEGLSVGDALGERFFLHPAVLQLLIGERALPEPPWRFTDDTQMALSLVITLKNHGEIDQKQLARSFGRHYDLSRGYGPAMHQFLPRVRSGIPWTKAAHDLFGGQGSFGNGGAMRVAPLGAYFADNRAAVIAQARKSAEVTHAHPEAAAGAIAVALAAAAACHAREEQSAPTPWQFLEQIVADVPPSAVRDGIVAAREMSPEQPIAQVTQVLGNGSKVSAQDTVPFTLWCAAHHLADYEEAIWTAISGFGDRDTTAAIVGGIVACFVGVAAIPADWRHAREPLPTWDA